jgi:hypothetical protein
VLLYLQFIKADSDRAAVFKSYVYNVLMKCPHPGLQVIYGTTVLKEWVCIVYQYSRRILDLNQLKEVCLILLKIMFIAEFFGPIGTGQKYSYSNVPLGQL